MLAEIGDPGGFPVVFHNGTPCSRLLPAWWDAPARERGLRILSFDRPAYGVAPAEPGRTVAGVVEETASALAELGLTGRFAAWGASGGGPYALGCGALLADRVVAVASIAGNAPLELIVRDDYVDEIAAVRRGRAGRDALVATYEADAAPMRSWDVETLLGAWDESFSQADKQVLGDGETGAYLLDLIQDAIRLGVEGWVDDNLAYVSPWGFALGDVRTPVTIWHGEEDLMVDVEESRVCAAAIPRAELIVIPAAGHPSAIFRHAEPVMDWLATYIAE